MKGILLWLIGIRIPIIILLTLFSLSSTLFASLAIPY